MRQVCVFVSQKPAARPYPDGLNSKIPIHEHTEESGSVRERLRSEHLEWLAQLKGLARNLNQLTRLAHTQGFTAVAVRHATLHAELVRMIEALRHDR